MSVIFGNDFVVILLFGISVFTFSYLMSDKLLYKLHERSLGNREEVLRLLDMMFVETDRTRVTLLMFLLSFGLGALVFLIFWPNLVVGIVMGFIVTLIGWSIPKNLMRSLWEKRCTRFTDQMVDGLTIMSNGIKSGLSITQSMERVVMNMTGPIAQEYTLVLNKIRLGMSVEEALNEMGDRVPRQDVQMFVTAVNILKETGGNLSETFSTIVMTIRERQKVEKKIQAMTAQGLMQAVIITLVPFVLLIIFLVIDPNYVKPLFSTPLGWIALAIMLGLQVIGGVMMKKIVTIRV
ncbi:MAG: type II secretion system F family protein [Bdellovibrionales bacterium]|jgi:tight adherence protein B|nr:type II secretion system F family protein [Bdellovibrionales bacterium]